MQFLPIVLALTITSTKYVSAYISTGLPPHRHKAWLERLTCDICQSPPGNLTPEMLQSTPQIISAWARNPCTDITSGKECALEVERLLKRLVDERRAGNVHAVTTTALYNAALAGWARSGEKGPAAQRAELILIEMQDLFHRGDVNVQPDTESFRAVMLAWSRSGERNAPERAERVLKWMVDLYEASENDAAVPDADCFKIVLHTYARSGQKGSARKIEELLTWMEQLHKSGHEDLKPQTSHFNAVVTAWTRSEEKGFVKRATDILLHMEYLAETGIYDVSPNLSTYTTVIRACAKHGCKGNAKRAEYLLKLLEKKFKQGNTDLRPDNLIYNFAIDSWTKSNDEEASSRARKILNRLIRMSKEVRKAQPDVYSYTSVMSAAASSCTSCNKKKNKAFDICNNTYRELCESDHVNPNHVSYGTMFKAYARLLPKGRKRNEYIRETFHVCCREGQVGDMVLTWLPKAASPSLYRELMGNYGEDNLPKEWTRNVGADKVMKKSQEKTAMRS